MIPFSDRSQRWLLLTFLLDRPNSFAIGKVEKALTEAPVDVPAVILLNFRDKLEEDAVAAAASSASAPQSGTPSRPPISTETVPDTPQTAAEGAEKEVETAEQGGAAPEEGVTGGGDRTETTAAAKDDAGEGGKGGGGGAWGHVATLETARLMMERVKEADEAEGRGAGRRISLFDCSMKNCFGLRVSDFSCEPVSMMFRRDMTCWQEMEGVVTGARGQTVFAAADPMVYTKIANKFCAWYHYIPADERPRERASIVRSDARCAIKRDVTRSLG